MLILSQCLSTFLTRGPSQRRSFLGPNVMFQMSVACSSPKDTFPSKIFVSWFIIKNGSNPMFHPHKKGKIKHKKRIINDLWSRDLSEFSCQPFRSPILLKYKFNPGLVLVVALLLFCYFYFSKGSLFFLPDCFCSILPMGAACLSVRVSSCECFSCRAKTNSSKLLKVKTQA